MSKTTKTLVVPSNPADLKKIKEAVQEACDCLLRADAEKEQVKAIVEDLVEAFPDINAKFVKRMISDRHRANFEKKAAENDDYATLYETVFG